MKKKTRKTVGGPRKGGKKRKVNERNKRLRVLDGKHSKELSDGKYVKEIRYFYNNFSDNKGCDKRLMAWRGWKENISSSEIDKITLIFSCKETLKNGCDSNEATKIPRKDEAKASVGIASDKKPENSVGRWVYQCKGCGKQFNLYTGTIFLNRKTTDIFIYFLSFYVMYMLGGKMPRTWLVDEYLKFLNINEDTVGDHEEYKKIKRKIVERIRRITSKISDQYFHKNTKAVDFHRMRDLLFHFKSHYCTDYDQWRENYSEASRDWKISFRAKDYSRKRKKIVDCANKHHLDYVYKIQKFKEKEGCKQGDWVLRIKRAPCKKKILYNWFRVDEIIEIKPQNSKPFWLAVQLEEKPTSHYKPFDLDKKFMKNFRIAVEKYEKGIDKKMPFDDIIERPKEIDIFLDTCGEEYMRPV